eukprot:6189415-Pleurochrysis_carterae.AAC.2
MSTRTSSMPPSPQPPSQKAVPRARVCSSHSHRSRPTRGVLGLRLRCCGVMPSRSTSRDSLDARSTLQRRAQGRCPPQPHQPRLRATQGKRVCLLAPSPRPHAPLALVSLHFYPFRFGRHQCRALARSSSNP